jgi:inorganic pyrophosphatase
MKNACFHSNHLNPWHCISVGNNYPRSVNAIIEIAQGSKTKYEIDKETGILRLDRILSTHLSYPVHYGFVPQTLSPDHDPLDMLVICSEQLVPLCVLEVTILGGLNMIDEGEQDDKIIGVATHDPLMKNKTELHDINPEILNAIDHFFSTYKEPEKKKVITNGFMSREQACIIVQESIDAYKKKWNASL